MFNYLRKISRFSMVFGIKTEKNAISQKPDLTWFSFLCGFQALTIRVWKPPLVFRDNFFCINNPSRAQCNMNKIVYDQTFLHWRQIFIVQHRNDLPSKQYFEGLDLLWSWMEFHVMGLISKVFCDLWIANILELLSFSVAEISAEEEAKILPLLCTEAEWY